MVVIVVVVVVVEHVFEPPAQFFRFSRISEFSCFPAWFDSNAVRFPPRDVDSDVAAYPVSRQRNLTSRVTVEALPYHPHPPSTRAISADITTTGELFFVSRRKLSLIALCPSHHAATVICRLPFCLLDHDTQQNRQRLRLRCTHDAYLWERGTLVSER